MSANKIFSFKQLIDCRRTSASAPPSPRIKICKIMNCEAKAVSNGTAFALVLDSTSLSMPTSKTVKGWKKFEYLRKISNEKKIIPNAKYIAPRHNKSGGGDHYVSADGKKSNTLKRPHCANMKNQ